MINTAVSSVNISVGTNSTAHRFAGSNLSGLTTVGAGGSTSDASNTS